MRKYLFLLAISMGFSSLYAQNYKMKVTKNNGETIEIPADDIQDITFETSTSPQQPDRFVTIGGIKWATGNLQYDKGTWKIADHQWDYFKPRYGYHGNSSEAYNFEIMQADDQIDHFNYGVCGPNALTHSNTVFANTTKVNISGKMYTDDKLQNETTNFQEAAFGDIAYWATNGKYRMPTYQEILKLTGEASWQFGYVIVESDKRIYGYLVTEPDGYPMKNKIARELKKEEIDKGLFLPCAGSRYDNTNAVKYAGYGGYYFASILFEDSKDWARSLQFDNDDVYDNNGEDCRHGNSIRPILVE
ncbi:MAG: hypothetical protein ACTTIF_03365 [Prevotella sp.]